MADEARESDPVDEGFVGSVLCVLSGIGQLPDELGFSCANLPVDEDCPSLLRADSFSHFVYLEPPELTELDELVCPSREYLPVSEVGVSLDDCASLAAGDFGELSCCADLSVLARSFAAAGPAVSGTDRANFPDSDSAASLDVCRSDLSLSDDGVIPGDDDEVAALPVRPNLPVSESELSFDREIFSKSSFSASEGAVSLKTLAADELVEPAAREGLVRSSFEACASLAAARDPVDHSSFSASESEVSFEVLGAGEGVDPAVRDDLVRSSFDACESLASRDPVDHSSFSASESAVSFGVFAGNEAVDPTVREGLVRSSFDACASLAARDPVDHSSFSASESNGSFEACVPFTAGLEIAGRGKPSAAAESSSQSNLSSSGKASSPDA